MLHTALTTLRRMPLTMADLRGLSRLGFDATLGVTNLVEQMHRTISDGAAPWGAPRVARTRGITGVVYRVVRGTTHVLGRGLDASLKRFESPAPQAATWPAREATIAAINGIFGDHLEASGNPLAITMQLRAQGRPIELGAAWLKAALPQAHGRLVVLLHGLCMNDLQWQRDGHDHVRMLEAELGYTALTLHYNSGLHVADNGKRLATLLDSLVAHWPVPVEELALVGHSMGGLVLRSALSVAQAQAMPWRSRVKRLVCMGTPHHGAMLERGGHLVDTVLGVSPYVAPFARLGKARSAGITDLRYGNLQGPDGHGRKDPTPTPLPADVSTYLLAATTAAEPRGLRHALIGDGLVTVASAWGEHRDKTLALAVPASHKRLIAQANHWDLLSRPEAAKALRDWLA